jgi:hypothetical protein
MAEWVRSRAVMLHCTSSLTDLGSNPGSGHGQPSRPYTSGVGKLVAISMQWVTAVEDCE